MPLIALKVLLAPLLIAACTFVAHRWGETVGGWLLGLPLVSGPVSVLLFVQYGPRFARDAARGTILGLVAATAFYACYAFVASRQPWWRSLLAAYFACIVTGAVLTGMHPDFAWSIVLVLAVLSALAWRMGAPRGAAPRPAPAVSKLVARMAIAGAMVCVVTAAAGILGPAAAGMLAPLPVVVAIMAASADRGGRRAAANNLLRGTLAGSWGGVAFFVVVGLMMGSAGPMATYVIATCAALTGAAVAIRVSTSETRIQYCPEVPIGGATHVATHVATRPSTAPARFAFRSPMLIA